MSKTSNTRKLNEFSFYFTVNKSGKMPSKEQGSVIQNCGVTFSGKYSLKSVVISHRVCHLFRFQLNFMFSLGRLADSRDYLCNGARNNVY